MTAIEREEKEKVKKKEKKQEEEETMQQATWVKYTFPVKHQVILLTFYWNSVSQFWDFILQPLLFLQLWVLNNLFHF